MGHRFSVGVIVSLTLLLMSVVNISDFTSFDSQNAVTPTASPTVAAPTNTLPVAVNTETPVVSTRASPVNGGWLLELLKITTSWNIELLKIFFAWPIILGLALLAFRKPLTQFLNDMGRRATKISIAQFSVELPASEGPPPVWTGAQLTEALQSSATTSGAKDLTRQFEIRNSFDHLIVDIEAGDKWLTSRLFLFTTMLQRMNDLQCVVFLCTKDNQPRTFLGVAHAEQIRWVLAQKFPWLEAAYVDAYRQRSPSVTDTAGKPMAVQPYIISDTGALSPTDATEVANAFLRAIQFRPFPDPAPLLPNELKSYPDEWVHLEPKPPEPPYWERGNWLTEERLRDDLRSILLTRAYVVDSPDLSPTKKRKAILNRPGSFVALVDEEKIFQKLIDRQKLLEDIGRDLAKPVDD